MPIKAEIGLNVSPFLKGAQEVKAATERMVKDTKGAQTKGGGGLQLEQGKRGERQIVGLTQDLMNARNAGDVLGATLGRAGDILKVGLGLGVASGLAGYFISEGSKINTAFDEVIAKSKEVREAASTAIEFGDVPQQLAALKETGAALASIAKQRKDMGGFMGGVANVLSAVSGNGTHVRKGNALDAEEKAQRANQQALFYAAKDQMETEAKIARLKSEGNDADAEALELAQKKKREIAATTNGMSEAQKALLTPAIDAKYDALAGAKALADARAAHLATEKEIVDLDRKENDLIDQRATLGETEAEHAARLVDEVGSLVTKYTQLEKHQGTVFQHEGDALAIAKARTAAAEKMNELAKSAAAVQKKANEEQARLAKSREEAMPGLAQNAYALAAAASGNKDIMREVERRTKYSNRRAGLIKEGFSPEQAGAIAGSESRLEDLKRRQEEQDRLKSTVGRADADRVLGLGGGAERGANVHGELQRKNNSIAEASLRELQTLNKLLGSMQPVKIDTKSRFN